MEKYFTNITLNQGIWQAKDTKQVSFPDAGHKDLLNFEDSSFWFKHRMTAISMLANRFCTDKTFLDIGGGNGYVSRGLLKEGFHPIMMEPGIEGCINSKNRGVESNICATLSDAGPIPNSIGSAGAFDVIEHIDDDNDFVQQAHSILTPGGIFIATVPALNILWSNDDVQAGHFRRHTIKSMSHLFESNGFEVLYCSYLFSFLVLPIFLFRSIPSRLGFNKSGTTVDGHSNDHAEKGGLLNKILHWTLRRELSKVKLLKSISLGSSVIIVAKKL